MIVYTQQILFGGIKVCLKAEVFLQEILLIWQSVNLCKAHPRPARAWAVDPD